MSTRVSIEFAGIRVPYEIKEIRKNTALLFYAGKQFEIGQIITMFLGIYNDVVYGGSNENQEKYDMFWDEITRYDHGISYEPMIRSEINSIDEIGAQISELLDCEHWHMNCLSRMQSIAYLWVRAIQVARFALKRQEKICLSDVASAVCVRYFFKAFSCWLGSLTEREMESWRCLKQRACVQFSAEGLVVIHDDPENEKIERDNSFGHHSFNPDFRIRTIDCVPHLKPFSCQLVVKIWYFEMLLLAFEVDRAEKSNSYCKYVSDLIQGKCKKPLCDT